MTNHKVLNAADLHVLTAVAANLDVQNLAHRIGGTLIPEEIKRKIDARIATWGGLGLTGYDTRRVAFTVAAKAGARPTPEWIKCQRAYGNAAEFSRSQAQLLDATKRPEEV